MQAKIISKYVYDGYYGTSNIYTMKGTDNIKYKWFSSKSFDTDQDILITSCSVKDIEDHPKYGKSVVLTRCYTKEL